MNPATFLLPLFLTLLAGSSTLRGASMKAANGFDPSRPVVDREAACASGVCMAAAAVPDVVGGQGDRRNGEGKSLPVGPIVATSAIAGLIALVLAIFRRRKSATAAGSKSQPAGKSSANP